MQRAFQQYLESLKRAGLTHVPKAETLLENFSITLPTNVGEGDLDGEGSHAEEPFAESVVPAPLKSRPNRPKVVEKPTEPVAPSLTLFGDDGQGVATPSTLTAEERAQKLAQLAEQVAACKKCEELARYRTQTVFGVGNPAAEIMFIGEAPGADEDRLGEPFVGRAGELMNKIIKACQLTREEIYICNILRCRPPGNRNPQPEEALNCREFLDAQIQTVDPDYIICWGKVAAVSLLGLEGSIGRMRGKWFKYGRAKVLCTYHPSYLLRQESAKKEAWKDMKFFRAEMGVDLS